MGRSHRHPRHCEIFSDTLFIRYSIEGGVFNPYVIKNAGVQFHWSLFKRQLLKGGTESNASQLSPYHTIISVSIRWCDHLTARYVAIN